MAIRFVSFVSLLLFSILLLPCSIHATQVDYCERGGDYDVEVKGVKISPDPAVRGKPATFSISTSTSEMSFRKMDDKKRPSEFVLEADLQGIRPLPSNFDKCKRYEVEDDRRGYSSERGRRSVSMV